VSKRHHEYSVPALVLGSGITALGVTRILGRLGIPVYNSSVHDPVLRRSRWYRPLPWAQDGVESSDAFAPVLDRCPHDRLVLIPCNDPWLRVVAELDARTARRFVYTVPPWPVVQRLVDKGNFAQALDEAGTPHPRTVLLRGESDLGIVEASPGARFFLKPRSSVDFFQRYGVKAFLVDSHAEALARYREIRAAGLDVMLQEYVPGSFADHYFIEGYRTRSGRIAARFARRRLRMEPPDFGNSTFMRTVPLDEVRAGVEDLEAFLAHIGYIGIYSAEFKRDARDGTLRILEINARPWWYVGFAEAFGADVCHLAYRDSLGMEVPQRSGYEVGAEGVYPYYDFRACLRLWRAGSLTLGEWARSWFGSWKPTFAADDPLPFFCWMWHLGSKSVRKRLGRS
jgi:D-aspartate ligase